jgi:recombination DNA repair RAD52 pathway protein
MKALRKGLRKNNENERNGKNVTKDFLKKERRRFSKILSLLTCLSAKRNNRSVENSAQKNKNKMETSLKNKQKNIRQF